MCQSAYNMIKEVMSKNKGEAIRDILSFSDHQLMKFSILACTSSQYQLPRSDITGIQSIKNPAGLGYLHVTSLATIVE